MTAVKKMRENLEKPGKKSKTDNKLEKVRYFFL